MAGQGAGRATAHPKMSAMHPIVAAASAIPRQRGDSPAADLDAVPAADPAPADRPWRRAVIHATLVYAISRVALTAITLFSWFGEVTPAVSRPGAVFRVWAVEFDTNWFLRIAAHGYPPHAPGEADAAFFPLFPYLIRAVGPLFLGHLGVAAVCVANAALFATLVVLYRLADHEFGPDTADRTLFYLLAFPTGFFLSTAYNEGLLIGLMVAAVYAMRRGAWWWAGVAGLFAATTRSAGILLIGAFIWEYVRQRGFRPRPDALAVLLIPAGLGAVMLTDRYYYHDALAFSHAQSVWGRRPALPWQGIIDTAELVVRPTKTSPLLGEVWTHNVLELSAVLLMLTLMVLMFVGPWRVRRDQFVLPLLGLAQVIFIVSFPSSMFQHPLHSASRLSLEVFAGFMLLGRMGADRRIDRTLAVIMLPLQGIMLAHFLHGGWVA